MKKILLFLMVAASCQVLAEDQVTSQPTPETQSYFERVKNAVSEYYANMTGTSVALDTALAYTIMVGTTVIHEMSHALATKLLYGVNSDTYIGFYEKDFPRKQPGDMTLSFVGVYPPGAEFYPDWPKDTERSAWKDFIVAITGPVCGVLTNYLALKAIDNSEHAKNLLFSKIMCLSGIIGHGAQFIPYDTPVVGTPSDGIRAYTALKAMIGVDKKYEAAI